MLPAVLDANVLYPAHLRDVLLHLAASGFYRPQWTARIHDEWTRNLLMNRPDLRPDQFAYTREQMDRAFPDALVEGYESYEADLKLPAPDDRHVGGAALAAGAELIVTSNLNDFPVTVLLPLSVEAISPDAFVRSFAVTDEAGVLRALRSHRSRLRKPPLTANEYVGHLERAVLIELAATVRGHMDEI